MSEHAGDNVVKFTLRPRRQILMPALSPMMEDGILARWFVKEGDQVKAGQIIAEIETDKATIEIEAIEKGRVCRILVPQGTAGVMVNTPIMDMFDAA